VKNLADVHESCLPRLGQVGRMDEDDVVQGIVVMRKGENPGEVIANLKDKIEDLNQNILPKDVKIVSFYDREDLVNLAVKTVTHNLIEGILLVTFIVLIFMADLRTTLIVCGVTDQSHFGHDIKCRHSYLPCFLVQSHKHSFHHHHGPINNDTEVNGSHRKQIGGHSHHP